MTTQDSGNPSMFGERHTVRADRKWRWLLLPLLGLLTNGASFLN
jgi:hypothetical protein